MPPSLPPGPTRHALRHAGWAADIVPDIGGSLARFSAIDAAGVERHWLRPAPSGSLVGIRALDMASFPLLPWCNRIRDGRFVWQGRSVRLSPNVAGARHPLHGIGWQRPWQVVQADSRSIDLVLDDDGGGEWPFPFRARQRYALDDGGLDIRLELVNSGASSMPAGIGHHPYFPHVRDGAGTRVTARVDAMWLSDAELLPTALSSGDAAVAALSRGMRLADFALDNNFTGFARTARIDWPDGSSLRVDASAPLDFMVLYSPADQPVFVLEAVSNCTDWINLLREASPGATHATVGGTSLAPGDVLVATTRLQPRPLPAQNRK